MISVPLRYSARHILTEAIGPLPPIDLSQLIILLGKTPFDPNPTGLAPIGWTQADFPGYAAQTVALDTVIDPWADVGQLITYGDATFTAGAGAVHMPLYGWAAFLADGTTLGYQLFDHPIFIAANLDVVVVGKPALWIAKAGIIAGPITGTHV
jgi:hypothetical protein